MIGVHIVDIVSDLTSEVEGITLLSEVHILILFLSLIIDSILLKLFFDMKWMKAVKISLVVNFLSGVPFPIIMAPLVSIACVLYVSEFVILGFVIALLIIFVSIKLLLVHIIFKISITKFRFLLFIIAGILTLLFTYGGSIVYKKIFPIHYTEELKELNSRIDKIPGYGGSQFYGCTMTVYLTDLNNSSIARDLLSTKFKYHPHLHYTRCGSNYTLLFKTAKYEYRELQKWLNLVVQSNVPGSKSISSRFNPNRISIFVEKQASVHEVQDMIQNLNLPLDAFVIARSRKEFEDKKFAETATLMKPVKKFDTVVLPAVLWSGKKAGELILGESLLSNVQRILPPFSGYGPRKIRDSQRKRVTWHSEEMHKVSEEVKYGYPPANSSISVGFNNRKKLILVRHMVPSPLATRLSDALDMVVDLQESYRDSKRLVKQGRITRCVIIATGSKFKGDIAQLSDVSYFYTCQTNSD